MKKGIQYFGVLLFATLLLLPFAVHADAAEAPTVVYLSGSVSSTADGLTPQTAVNTINRAYDLLDRTKDCTVVVCGAFTQVGNFAYAKTCD